jgi:hypothetical protein
LQRPMDPPPIKAQVRRQSTPPTSPRHPCTAPNNASPSSHPSPQP